MTTDPQFPASETDRVAAGIAALTLTERFALKLRVLCGLKTPEIAAAMGWTIAETQVAHNRVRRLVVGP